MGCYNDDVLFVHIPKTAGWAVKTYLRDNLPGVLMPDDPASKLPIGHVPLRDIERFTGRTPDSFQTIIAVIRNPYEQQLSQMCFWADRFVFKNNRHSHDIHTAVYCHLPQVMADWAASRMYEMRFTWLPHHLDLDGFVADPSCDFHLWYEQHPAFQEELSAEEQQRRQEAARMHISGERYEDYGGYYRYWLEVDGRIPTNVRLLRAESLQRELMDAINPFACRHPLPALHRKNTSSHGAPTQDYYSDEGRAAVERKFAYCFDTAEWYPKWQKRHQEPAREAAAAAS